MALAQTGNGLAFSATWLGRTGISGGPGLGTGMTIAFRVRWSVTTTTVDYTGAFMSAGTAATNQAFFTQRQASGTAGAMIGYRWTGSAAQTATATASGSFGSTTAWVHVCWVYDQPSALVRSYVNGVASGTGAAAVGTVTNTVTTLGIGPYSGNICDVLFMKRALTASEVNQLALRRAPIFRTGSDTVGWYPMTDSSSLAAIGTDYSGNGNNLTQQTVSGGVPTAASVSVPVGYAHRNNRVFRAPLIFPYDSDGTVVLTGTAGTGLTATQGNATGPVLVTGAAAMSQFAALQASGTLRETGTVATGLTGAIATPAGTLLETGVAAMSAAAAMTPSGTLRETGTALTSSAATMGNATGTLQETGVVTMGISLPVAASGTLQETGVVALGLSAAVVAAGTLQETGTALTGSTAAFAASGTLQETGTVAMGVTLPVAASGTLQETGTVATGLTGSVAASGTLNETGTALTSLNAAFAAAGTVQETGVVAMTSNAAGAINGIGTLQETGIVATGLSAAVAASGTLQETGVAALSSSAAFTASGTLAETGVVATGVSLPVAARGDVVLTGTALMSSSSAFIASAATLLTGSAAMLANYAQQASGTVALTGVCAMSGGTPPPPSTGHGAGQAARWRRSVTYAGRRATRR